MSGLHDSVISAMNETTNKMGLFGITNEVIYKEAYQDIHNNVADFLEVNKDDIALTSSTSYNMNIFALMLKSDQEQNIVTHCDEFPSTVLPFSHHGYNVKKIITSNGTYNPLDLLELIDESTAAIVISTVVSTTGFRPQLQELARQLESRSIPLILNATQSVGFFHLDLKGLNVSAMSASTHKSIGSVVGLAIAYISDSLRKKAPSPLLGWASVNMPSELSIDNQEPRQDATAIELASMPFSLLAALNQALKVHETIPIEKKSQQLLKLTCILRNGLENIGIKVLGSSEMNQLSSIISFQVEKPEQVLKRLEEKKVFLDIKRGHLRASLGLFNTELEVIEFITILKLILEA